MRVVSGVLFVLLLLLEGVCGGKIGIFVATISKSQLIFGYRLADQLAQEHEVVVVRAQGNPGTDGFQPVTSNNIRTIALNESVPPAVLQEFIEIGHRQFFGTARVDYQAAWANYSTEACDLVLRNYTFIDMIKAEKFDFVYLNHYEVCNFALVEFVGVPKWGWFFSSPVIELWLRNTNNPTPTSVVPNLLSNFTNNMDLVNRIINFGLTVFLDFHTYRSMSSLQLLIEKNLNGTRPYIVELLGRTKLYLLNDFEGFDYPRPLTSNVLYIGGVGMNLQPEPTVAEALPEDLQFLANSNRPLVLVAMGSLANPALMPAEWRSNFKQFFADNSDIDFIWKYEDPSETKMDMPSNVVVRNWLPQVQLLALPRMKGFISHCGFNGILESTFSSVPMLCIPLFGDEDRNARLLEYRHIGRAVTKSDMLADSLTRELKALLDEKNGYAKAVRELANKLRQRPFVSSDILLRWTQYAVENDFDYSLPNVGSVIFYHLDFLVPLAVAVLAVVALLIYCLVRTYYWSCCGMTHQQHKHKQD